MSTIISRLSVIITVAASLLSFYSCTPSGNREAERLNDIAYYYHYRSLDSVRVYADSVINAGGCAADLRAEALNNLAFYHIGRMHYATADSLLAEAYSATNNNIEQLITCIQQMRLCQRRSANKAFYEYRLRAMRHLNRISEEFRPLPSGEGWEGLSTHLTKRLRYAESELRLVTSVYDYYIGKADDAIAALHEVDSLDYLKQDTVQYVAYLYDIGSGGILTHGTKEDITHQELEYLMQCYVISYECGYTYWKANALQALSEHLVDDAQVQIPDNQLAQRYLNTANVPDSLLAGNLAQQALDIFRAYGDVYQQAAAWRTLSRCYGAIGDYPGAVYSLQQAQKVDTAITQSPALMASIHEQFSLAFSAMDMKAESDVHRNKYLDLYEATRMDRQLEARAEQLERQVQWQNVLIYIVVALVVILVAVLAVLLYMRHRSKATLSRNASLRRFADAINTQLTDLADEQEELAEQTAMAEHQLERQQEVYAEQRAKMHLLNSITPLLGRLLHETSALAERTEDDSVRAERREYITELIDKVNAENNFLTSWIQLARGELSLRIESFQLQQLFEVIAKSAAAYSHQGVTLIVEPTDEVVKADRTLTLFMLNTLGDNARKYTPQGGTVTISAAAADDDMVEISVTDTGTGMSDAQCTHIFDIKPVVDQQLTTGKDQQQNHGFGLLNCKGIIEKYKKTNAFFAHCMIDVESKPGKGSRFYFRLPKGLRKMAVIIALIIPCSMTSNTQHPSSPSTQHPSPNTQHPSPPTPSQLADSIYTCNIQGRYADAISYGRQCLHLINTSLATSETMRTDTLMIIDPLLATPADIRLLNDSVNIDYQVLLSLRNEIAVAALALHQWDVYRYNNKAYTLLFKELSADATLSDFCRKMEATESNRNIAIILLIILLLAIIPVYYLTYYRHVISDVRKERQRLNDTVREQRQRRDEMQSRLDRLTFELDRLHVANNVMSNSLSTIKHETMYYPSRIQQLLLTGDDNEIDATARYYRAIYDVLCQQAMANSSRLLPADVLRRIMMQAMARLAGIRRTELPPPADATPYYIYIISIVHPDDVTLKVLTQVVRDLGEAYNLHRCGIVADGTKLTITAPKTS